MQKLCLPNIQTLTSKSKIKSTFSFSEHVLMQIKLSVKTNTLTNFTESNSYAK